MPVKTKITRRLTVLFAAAIALVVSGPTTNSFASDYTVPESGNISEVTCVDGKGFLKIWYHNSASHVRCYANAGVLWMNAPDRGDWFDRVQTGNNDVWLYDRNGDIVSLPRWTDTVFPNRPLDITEIRIL
ncbi:beta/gamma crystallin domain-containing protein [Streptomyces sp. NPDC047024]|uniref:beta/gamma crystallin domain-containing protein n=1 Tax=Streptomyces sp. NPDC047024 TaxID=3155476 RepID=UPI0033EB8169